MSGDSQTVKESAAHEAAPIPAVRRPDAGRRAAPAAAPDTRLAEAVKARNMTAARALLAQGASATTALGDGATALHWAAHWDDDAIAGLLLEAGAKADAADDHRITPLGLAATNGSTAMIQRLLAAGANPNAAFETGETPFMRAVRVGRVEAVRALLAGGADVNARETFRSQSALMWAVAFNHADVVRLLTAHRADVHARLVGGFTPLLFAAQQGSLAITRTLVEAGADVNDTVRAAPAPVPAAPAGPGGRRRRSDVDGSSVLQVAVDSGFMVTSRLAASAETVASGFSVSTEHEAVALFLLERGADPTRNGAGRTALHSAVRAARPALVKALLAHGADPNARLEQPLPRLLGQITGDEIIGLVGTTPFWLAASYADIGLMKMLAAAGADSDDSRVGQDHAPDGGGRSRLWRRRRPLRPPLVRRHRAAARRRPRRHQARPRARW